MGVGDWNWFIPTHTDSLVFWRGVKANPIASGEEDRLRKMWAAVSEPGLVESTVTCTEGVADHPLGIVSVKYDAQPVKGGAGLYREMSANNWSIESKGQFSDILEPFSALANSPGGWFVWYREIMAAVETARRSQSPFSKRVKQVEA